MVAGSSGAYFHIADKIVQMDNYIPCEITAEAKAEAAKYPVLLLPENEPDEPDYQRAPSAGRMENNRGRSRSERGQGSRDDARIKIKGMGKESVSLNKETINLHYVEQITDSEQVMTLGYLLAYAEANLFNGKSTMQQIVDKLMERIEKEGLGSIVPGSYLPSGLALPRRQEIFACFNRYRGLGL